MSALTSGPNIRIETQIVGPSDKEIGVIEGQFTAVSSQDHTDIAHVLYKESLEMDPMEREIIAKRVLRKLDFVVLPMMCFVYFLSFLDKSTLNYANAYGLQTDLHLVGRNYSWIASITNFGYLAFAFPMTVALQKLPIGKVIGTMLTLWGVVLIGTVGAKNFADMMVLRFILGGLESGIGPAWMLLTTMFWTKKEAPLRMSFWLGCNGLSQIIGSGLSWGLGHTHSHLSPWKLIFLVIGLFSFCFGAICIVLLPSSPKDCVFFSHKEALVAVWRVSKNRTGVKHSKILWYQVLEALKDPKIYLIAASALCLGILNGAISNFLTTLLQSFGYNALKSVLYQMPGGGFQFIFTVLGGLLASKVPNTLALTVILGYIPGLVGVIGILTLPLSKQLNLAACAWMLPITGLAIIITWNMVAANIAGHTKRTFTNGQVIS
ncbi:hypothetical protein OIDMADRAFT_62060 [Oidiodendron maius Zn]|uniref:Major facilitator superfamily (MFS) profile domain-containing protein n=1 Tax=Oidiodendron maius (strain Zn) TaxID=913774 RepID=A0A0C3GR16_OIDMZ|nr:hypothetical protein OIDMADRAFT_62060 [Oidiodendron maius Zn]